MSFGKMGSKSLKKIDMTTTLTAFQENILQGNCKVLHFTGKRKKRSLCKNQETVIIF